MWDAEGKLQACDPAENGRPAYYFPIVLTRRIKRHSARKEAFEYKRAVQYG